MKGIVFLLVLVLLGWMAGAEYVWLCHVKGHCGNGATDTLAQSATGTPATAAAEPVASTAPELEPAPALEATRDPTPPPGRSPTRIAAPDSQDTVDESGQQTSRTTAAAAEPDAEQDPPAATEIARAEPAAAALPGPANAPAPASPNTGGQTPPVGTGGALGEPRPITVTINNESVLETAGLRFEPGSWRVALALNGPEALRDLSEFLASRPELDAVVTGEYKDNETNTSSEADLGVARARSVIEALVDSGIARDRLSSTSLAVSRDAPGPAFSLETRDFSPLLETQLVMFPTGGVIPTTTEELRQYAADVGEFLNSHRGASLRITGHTDNTGDESNNENLSLARARAVAEYLGELGLPATRLRLAFRGQQEPVASNDTEAGRSRNRRVEIQLEMGRR